MKAGLLIAALVILGGCTSSYTEPSLSPDHPASPSAAPSTPPARGTTLDLAAADPITPPAQPAVDNQGADQGTGEKTESNQREPATEVGGRTPEAPSPSAPTTPALYACPMHPEVTSDKPDQRCPKCHMKLKPVSKTGESR